MIRALARVVTARPLAIVIFATIAVAACAVVGGGVTARLSTGGTHVPGSESETAARLLDEHVGGAPNLIVVIDERPTLGPAAAEAADDVAHLLATLNGVILEASAWGGGATGPGAAAPSPVVADDGAAGLITARISGTDSEIQAVAEEAVERLRDAEWPDGVTVEVGGLAATRLDLITITDDDLVRAELLALPFCVLLLLIFFRTPVAAALPLVVAAVAVIGTLAVLRGFVAITEVSIFARSVTTVLGLAMAMDMSLFLVARYREHRPEVSEPREAVRMAVERAGPSMLFSGLTTAASLAALVAFEQPILRSFAYAGSAVVLLALVGGLVVLPATMTLLGDRIDRWQIPTRRRRGERQAGHIAWYRLARWIMARPWPVAIGVLVLLVTLATPALRLEPGLNDDRSLPTSVESRRVADDIRTRFAALESGEISVAFVDGPTGVLGSATAEAAYLDELAALDGVARVDRGDAHIAVVPMVEPISGEGRALVAAIRAIESPVPVAIGGEAARLADSVDHLSERLPWALGATALAMAALLAIAFRSVLLPIKALLLNLLSLSAMFGAIVWVFQDGRFASMLGYTPVGQTDITVPALMFAVAFGLSMDYEVYLLGRMRESFLVTNHVPHSTAVGLARTGRILTASALLMAVVFASFITTSVTHLKVLGLGVTLAVLVDAFIVRTLLVPAFMAIAGRANWWPGARSRRSTEPLPTDTEPVEPIMALPASEAVDA